MGGTPTTHWTDLPVVRATYLRGMSAHNEPNRVVKGVPTGGQFDHKTLGEPEAEADLGGFYDSWYDEAPDESEVGSIDDRVIDRSGFADADLPGHSAGNPDAIDLPGFVHPRAEDAFFDAEWEIDKGATPSQAATHLKPRFHAMTEGQRVEALIRHREAMEAGDYAAARTVVEDATTVNQAALGIKDEYKHSGSVVVEPNAHGPVYGNQLVGSKYAIGMSTTEAAKNIRGDIKEAVAAGHLPAGLDYRVRKNHEGSMSISVRGLTNEQIFDKDEEVEEPGLYGTPQHPEMRELQDRLDLISNVYRQDRSESMVDYFDTNFYAFVRIETEDDKAWREKSEEEDKKRKAERAERRQMRDRLVREHT